MKPEVSILMNCFNCEQYLTEAIESVFNQTVQNWELIFVDNCSCDKSAEIAKSFGDKVKIVKTTHNIPLGAARNYGFSHCSGDYIAILDADDIWFPYTIEKQLGAMKSGDFALVYGGQLNIDCKGNQIGMMKPKPKQGDIFEDLLMQFDIPIVTTMLSKKHLIESGLGFDKNVTASEEYCLFLQLAAKYSFAVIDEVLVKYRIHDNSLTNKSISKWAEERRYTLNKIINEVPGVRNKYSKGFSEAFARSDYYEVQYLVEKNEIKKARSVIKKNIFLNYKYLLLFVFLFLPKRVWDNIMKFKYKR